MFLVGSFVPTSSVAKALQGVERLFDRVGNFQQVAQDLIRRGLFAAAAAASSSSTPLGSRHWKIILLATRKECLVLVLFLDDWVIVVTAVAFAFAVPLGVAFVALAKDDGLATKPGTRHVPP